MLRDGRFPADVPPLTGTGVPVAASALHVGGVVPFTTTDYPDALAAVVFCQGCPWRCGYCHNPHLIPARGDVGHDFGAILDWLQSRRGLLDAVVFSGGEPTAQPALPEAMAEVRRLGFLAGLHTGGAYPRRLADALPFTDWIGLDVKAPRGRYEAVTGVAGSDDAPFACLDLVRERGVAHEVRTTVHPGLLPADALEDLARELAARGVIRWILQPFRPTGCANDAVVAAAPHGAVLDSEMLGRLSRHVPIIEVRG
ncbi:MAG: anaerobic ribonucleoside-triphosphate reductase activating protein [Burkholderiales bacterium]